MANTMIDLRSDTVTKPSAEMRRAMAEAEVGDDVFLEDPTVNKLQERAAQNFGREAALFVPSGSMGNLACVMAQTRPGQEVICETNGHVYNYEMGALPAIGGGRPSAVMSKKFDSVQFCLSRGLGAPVGSMIVGTRDFIERCRPIRKMLGGGMRQAGVLAAAGLVALEKGPKRLQEDHDNARILAERLAQTAGITLNAAKGHTNIVIFSVKNSGLSSADFLA